MKKTIILSTIFILLLKTTNCLSQDPFYSQYFMSPMTLNPALIGKGISDMRFLALKKTQWWGQSTAAFSNTSISFEKKINSIKNTEDDLGIAIAMSNEASNGGLLKKTYGSLGAAYNKKINKFSSIGVGLIFTYANTLLDPSKFEFQSQFGSFGFNRMMPSNDPVQIINRSYLDVNGGIRYSYVKNNWGLNLGAAIYHAAKPKEGAFNNSNYYIKPRTSLQASIFKKIKEADEFNVSFNADLQGNSNVYSLGALYKLQIPGNHIFEKISTGVWARFNDAIYPYFGLESKQWSLGFTYDIITSDLKTYSNSVQSMEISFGWQFSSKKKNKPLSHVRMVEL